MKKSKTTASCFAICVHNSEYPASLEMLKVCRIIPDNEAEGEGDLRVIDESGEDYLYPADYFVLIEIPDDAARTLKKSFARSFAENRHW